MGPVAGPEVPEAQAGDLYSPLSRLIAVESWISKSKVSFYLPRGAQAQY